MSCHVEVIVPPLESSQSPFTVCGFWEFKLSVLEVFAFICWIILLAHFFFLCVLPTYHLLFFLRWILQCSWAWLWTSDYLPLPPYCCDYRTLNCLAGRIILILSCWDNLLVHCVKVVFVLFKFAKTLVLLFLWSITNLSVL